VTDILDLLGSLLLILAVGMAVAQFLGVVAALVAAGLLVLALSWGIDRRGGGGK
jgi:hypothetical protein